MFSQNEAQAINLLSRLVQIPSVTDNETEACTFLAQALCSLGWEKTRIDEVGNVIAQRGEGEREIVLLGHIDTVGGGPEPRIDGDILWGRGSVDAKGALCTFAVAGGAFAVPDGWKVTLIAATGEEGDSRGARNILSRHKPCACIVGEPSGTDGITIGYRGYIRLRIRASDGGAHRSASAGPLTACLMSAADILREVERRDDETRPIIERPSGAVISMFGAEEGERVAAVDLDIRLPVGIDDEKWAGEFLELGAKRGAQASRVSSMPAHLADKGSALVRALRVAVRESGLSPRILAKGGTADFNLAARWNCDIAAYGPGDSKLDHTSDEHISIKDYLTAISILTNALSIYTHAG